GVRHRLLTRRASAAGKIFRRAVTPADPGAIYMVQTSPASVTGGGDQLGRASPPRRPRGIGGPPPQGWVCRGRAGDPGPRTGLAPAARPGVGDGQARRPRRRSSWRRSRLVGRPAPRSRTNAGAARSGGGAAGVWSTRQVAATGAPTRLSITRATSSTRVRPLTWAWTRSPTRTGVAGLAGTPLTRTCPPRHAAVARPRVLYSRTAHSHLSTRVSSTAPIVPDRA